MPFHFWSEMPTTVFASGRLWPGALSLQHVGRGFGSWMVPCTPSIPVLTLGAQGTTTRDIVVVYPDSWAIDENFTSMKLVLQVMVVMTLTGFTVTPSGQVQLIGGSNAPGLVGAERYMTKDYTTLPTGPTTETIELTWTAVSGTSISLIRTATVAGATCAYGLVPV